MEQHHQKNNDKILVYQSELLEYIFPNRPTSGPQHFMKKFHSFHNVFYCSKNEFDKQQAHLNMFKR